jgi:hypothetical protein
VVVLALTLLVGAVTPAPDEILQRAAQAWQSRAVAAYESFTLPCDQTSLSAQCNPDDDAQFVVRMADGRTFAQSLPRDGAASQVLLRGGYIFGPGGAPLGFYRRVGATPPPSPPPDLAPDPLELKTIATVTSAGDPYDVTLVGIESINGRRCYHLRLRPLGDPDRFPLRELWVGTADFEVVALTYDWDFGSGHRGRVSYRFAPIGPRGVWAIERIDADVDVRHEVFTTRTEHVGSDLRDITFPADWPAADFATP